MQAVIPSTVSLHLDTRFHIHATAIDGTLLRDENGTPITIAQDMISGAWFALVADSMPHRATNEQRAKMDMLQSQDAVHVPHDNEKFRGVWVPLDQLESDLYDAEFTDGAGDDAEVGALPGHVAQRHLTSGEVDASLPSKAAKRTAAKKAAKRVN